MFNRHVSAIFSQNNRSQLSQLRVVIISNPTMPPVSKRKAHSKRISELGCKAKRQKLERETGTRSRFLIQQRRDEDNRDEYESYGSEPGSDKSSSDEQSSDESDLEGEEKGKKKGNAESEMSRHVMNLSWTPGAGTHLRGTRGCGSASTDKCQWRHKRELAVQASQSRSILEMFGNQPQLVNPSQSLLSVEHKTKYETRLQASQDLEDLLRHTTKQTAKYKKTIPVNSDWYRRHQMVQTFLWLQENKETDNPTLNRRDLACLAARSFCRRNYTGRKIVQWEKSWILYRTIPETKAGSHKHNLTWMEDEDLVLSVKEWARSLQDGMYFFLSNIYVLNFNRHYFL